MWTCVECGLGLMFTAVKPDKDASGFYFICLGCETRNELVNVGWSGNLELVQPED